LPWAGINCPFRAEKQIKTTVNLNSKGWSEFLTERRYDCWIYNLSDTSVTVDVWFYAFLPSGNRYGPFQRRNGIAFGPQGMKGKNNLKQRVPGNSPAGEYTFVGYIGKFESTIIDSSYFTFTKESSTVAGIEDDDLVPQMKGHQSEGVKFPVEDYIANRSWLLPE